MIYQLTSIIIEPSFVLICSLDSSLRSQGILHSFSGTETDRIWPYINSLLSTKMHIQPSNVFQTQTPWHSSEWKDQRETSRSRQKKWGDVSTCWPQLWASSLITKFRVMDKDTDQKSRFSPTCLWFSHLLVQMNACKVLLVIHCQCSNPLKEY